jgi:basic membrane lipoprotein Med (substrate-binding protein (PBP1-ABC) superfamily)
MMRRSVRWFYSVLFAATLAACSQSGPRTVPAKPPTATIPAVPSSTSAPFALLMAPDSPFPDAQKKAIQAVETFCQQKGLALKRITPGDNALGDFPQGAPSLVAAVGSGFGKALVAAAQAHPEIRFVAVEEGGVQPLPNLLVVGGDYVRIDQVAFLAGALATVENRNEYVGWIGQSGTVIGTIYRYSFIHGVRYVCPRCRLFDFELETTAGGPEGISAAESLQTDYADTASAIPSEAGDAALTELAKRGIRVAGTRPDFFTLLFAGGQSVGSKNALGGPAFRPDLLLADLLPRFLGGETFSEAAAYSLENHSLEYAPFPNDWISPGRQAFLQSIISDLTSGRLDIGVDPKTGEER